MTSILGISGYYHDSAAALLVDGHIVAAAQEERFTRKKHDHRFPENAIRFCLEQAGMQTADLDHVVFYDKPLLKFERLLETYLSFAPAGFPSFLRAMPLWLRQKLYIPREIRKGLAGEYKGRCIFTEPRSGLLDSLRSKTLISACKVSPCLTGASMRQPSICNNASSVPSLMPLA